MIETITDIELTIPSGDDRNFYFIYGNHGDSPIQLEDYFLLIQALLDYTIEKPLFVSKNPVPGHWNILLECFDEEAVGLIRRAKKEDPRTRIVCIATEFRTGNTFNSFEETHKISKVNLLLILDHFLRSARIIAIAKNLPNANTLKRHYKRWMKQLERWIENRGGSSHYTNNSVYWKKRYDCFFDALPYFDQVWIVSPGQRAGYVSLVDPDNLWDLSIIPYTDHVPEPSGSSDPQDVDCLFTGTMTPHRLQIVKGLRNKGLKVVLGFFPTFLKNTYMNQSKVCLHLKPHEDWPFSSNMRLHTLLMAGKYVISEVSGEKEEEAIQRNFVEEVPSDRFVETVASRIADPRLGSLGLKARKNYVEATRKLRLQVRDEFRRFVGEAEKGVVKR